MRNAEVHDSFGHERLRPADPHNPESFKVRRGKVGGYVDYLSSEDIAYVDAYGNPTNTPPDPTVEKEEISAESIEIGVPKREKEAKPFEKTGKVAFFDTSKGYGFINEEISGERFFVHVTGLIDSIQENDQVRFELEKGPKGLNAVKVEKI